MLKKYCLLRSKDHGRRNRARQLHEKSSVLSHISQIPITEIESEGTLDLCISMRYNKETDLMMNFSTLMLSLAAPKVSWAQKAKKHVMKSPI